MTDKFKNKYRIASARYQDGDYNEGTFFITICTHQRNPYFGDIMEGTMRYHPIGEYADKCIQKIPQLYPYAEILNYVVMPNHIHLIIKLSPHCVVKTPHCDVSTTVSTRCDASQPTRGGKTYSEIARSCGRVSHIISRFKYAVTHYAKQEQIEFGWQSRFHDHIIRNDWEYLRISDYIDCNVENWHKDCFSSE